DSPRRNLDIELATAPSADKIEKRWNENIAGDTTSFLVSPTLSAEASQLRTATEMTERRLRWAIDATGGERHAPKDLLLQTTFWGAQRKELHLKEAKILSLVGFNVVGVPADMRAQFPYFLPSSASFYILL